MIDELALLLDKVKRSEDLVQRAELYFYHTHHQWSDEVAAMFKDTLERKKDQINYEWSRIEQMGLAIATDRDPDQLDI